MTDRSVEGCTLTVVGELAPYATVEPATLLLYPESEGSATVTITLPRDAGIEAGEVPFGVVVEPQEHPADTAVPDAVARRQAQAGPDPDADTGSGQLAPRSRAE